MARAKTHKDVEFAVELLGVDGKRDYDHKPEYYKTFDEAMAAAASWSVSRGLNVYVDALVWSKAGAKWYGGDDAVEQYQSDPEASVFERFVVRVKSEGMIA